MRDAIGPLFAGTLALAAGAPAQGQAPESVGVTAAVQPQARGSLAGRGSEELRIGNDIFHDQRVTTGPNGRAQLLFLDETRLTVGPSQELVLNLYRYDPRTRQGDLHATVGPGTIRVTAGAMSEASKTIRLHFTDAGGRPVGSAEFHRRVVAGVSVAPNGETTILSLTGGLVVASNNRGETARITRGGFASKIGLAGAPTAPARARPAEVDALLAGLEGRSGTGQRADERTLGAVEQRGSSLSVNQAAPGQFDRSLRGVNPGDLEALGGLSPTRPNEFVQRGAVGNLPPANHTVVVPPPFDLRQYWIGRALQLPSPSVQVSPPLASPQPPPQSQLQGLPPLR